MLSEMEDGGLGDGRAQRPDVDEAPPKMPPKQLRRKRAALGRTYRRAVDESAADLSALESNLLSAAKGRALKTLFVTSARGGEGKTTVALAIAHALAGTSGGRVLVVDANLTSPALQEAFGVGDAPGLTDFLASRVEGGDVVIDTDCPGLCLMTRGTAVNTVSGVFGPRVFKGKLDALAGQFDYVIFDGDSVLSSSNATLIAMHFDGVLIVAECENTKWEVLQLAREKLESVGGSVLGVALNKRRHYIPRGLYGKV